MTAPHPDRLEQLEIQGWIRTGLHDQVKLSRPLHECPHCGDFHLCRVQTATVERFLFFRKGLSWDTEYEQCGNCGYKTEERPIND